MTEHPKQATILQIRSIDIGTLARVRQDDGGVIELDEIGVCYHIEGGYFHFLFESGAYREFSFFQAIQHLILYSAHPAAQRFAYSDDKGLITAYLSGVFDEVFATPVARYRWV